MSARCCASRPPPAHNRRHTGRSSPMLAVKRYALSQLRQDLMQAAGWLKAANRPQPGSPPKTCMAPEAVHSPPVPPTFKSPCAGGHYGPPVRI
eukprot:3942009-Amphidinium_carterae.1